MEVLHGGVLAVCMVVQLGGVMMVVQLGMTTDAECIALISVCAVADRACCRWQLWECRMFSE